MPMLCDLIVPIFQSCPYPSGRPAFQDLPHRIWWLPNLPSHSEHMMITQGRSDHGQKWPANKSGQRKTQGIFLNQQFTCQIVEKLYWRRIYLLCLHNNIFTLWIEPANKSRPNCISCSPHRNYGEGLPPPTVILHQDLTHVLCFACLQCKRIACSSRTRLLCGLWQCVPSYAPSK